MTETRNVKFERKVNKKRIPTCCILGVQVAAIDMNWLLQYLEENVGFSEGNRLTGDYICVTNVFADVIAFQDSSYRAAQNNALLCIPDGGPLSAVAHKRGCVTMRRTTGPDLMGEIFKISSNMRYKHYFYGSTTETLRKLKQELSMAYPDLQIVGMFSPPFGSVTEEECVEHISLINVADPDFVWVGLGAPKQEKWMALHQGKVKGLMIGVGAGFDYYAKNIRRAPEWMQKSNLEWLCRLLQDPRRLFLKYLRTNWMFIWNAYILGK